MEETELSDSIMEDNARVHFLNILRRRIAMEKEKIKLSDAIKEKLGEAVELWADDYLVGKPAILANATYFKLENALIKSIQEINETFGD